MLHQNKTLNIRFYGDLNDFLPITFRQRRFKVNFKGRETVKDFIQSLGVPHTEYDLILINGCRVLEDYVLQDGDDCSVFPHFVTLNNESENIKEPIFYCDVHLGKLARFLRMVGMHSEYSNNWNEREIIKKSKDENGLILTKNLNLLKRNDLEKAYFVRANLPENQLVEIITKFNLKNRIKEFSRCLICGNLLEEVGVEKVAEKIPPKVKDCFNEFFYCSVCDKIYWRGSHYLKMKALIKKVLKKV